MISQLTAPAALASVKLGRIFWLRTDKPNRHGFCPVSLRLTAPGNKHADTSTGVTCRPADWAGAAGKESCLKKSHPEYELDTDTLATMRVNAKAAQKRLEALGQPVTPQAVAALLRNPKALEYKLAPCLLEFMEEELESHYKLGNRATYESQRSLVSKLRAWHGPGRLPLGELTPKRAQAFYNQLVATKARGGEVISANKVIRHLEGMFRRGIPQAMWSEAQNPFACIRKLTPPKKVKVCLTTSELQAVCALDLDPTDWLWRARAAWLLQFYLRGERIGACLLLRWPQVRNGRIEYQAQKGGPFKQVPLRGLLAELIALFHPRRTAGNTFVLPYLPDKYDKLDAERQLAEVKKATALINKALKKIALLAEVDKALTTHAARRTFATLGRKVVGVGAIQGMLGHTTERMTQEYLNGMDFDEQDSAADTIFRALHGQLNPSAEPCQLTVQKGGLAA